jgi:RNA polymerase sigma-70 factor (ECF subfamily)
MRPGQSRTSAEDAAARFYRLLWPLAPLVLRTARILTGRDADAEDLAQDTLMKAFRAIDSFQEGTDPKGWLMAILRNTRIDRIRSGASRSRDVSLEQLDFEPAEATPVEDVKWQRPQDVLEALGDRDIIDALQNLPEEMRWTLLLVDVEGMDQDSAAGVLDVPTGTIKSRLHRGRAMLRVALEPLARDRGLLS